MIGDLQYLRWVTFVCRWEFQNHPSHIQTLRFLGVLGRRSSRCIWMYMVWKLEDNGYCWWTNSVEKIYTIHIYFEYPTRWWFKDVIMFISYLQNRSQFHYYLSGLKPPTSKYPIMYKCCLLLLLIIISTGAQIKGLFMKFTKTRWFTSNMTPNMDTMYM